ncbi:MAG: LuxR C-terminal-related transcriptional regulator [Planctomycetota bacterium]|nr:LuxR C-terminal-related transcriptional regulator [Planctomycetota bacterium]
MSETSLRLPADPKTQALWEALVCDPSLRIVIFDREGRIIYCNDAVDRRYAPILGKDTIVGLSLPEITPPEYAAERMDIIRRVIETGRPMVVQGVLEGISNRIVYRRMPYGDNGQFGVIAIGRDLTELDNPQAAAAAKSQPMEVRDAQVRDLGPLSECTPRELMVLALIGEGLPTTEIAARLHRSEKTVEWHRTGLARKLGVRNRVELARLAIRANLTPESVKSRFGELLDVD